MSALRFAVYHAGMVQIVLPANGVGPQKSSTQKIALLRWEVGRL